MTVTDLPALNAALNATATILLIAGYLFIRRGDRVRHTAAMLGAFGVSAAFLMSYVVYHSQVGSKPYGGEGILRPIYFAILATHVVLAAAILPLALVTLRHALAERFAEHRRIARWTWPIWIYVSVTGVIIYVMLYRL